MRIQSTLLLLACLLLSCGGTDGCSTSSNNQTVVAAPTISSAGQPLSQTVTAGQTATFTVTAAGTVPLSYQWKKDGTAINSATGASYTTPVTTTADSGSTFTVTVSNSAGNITSGVATLTVNPINTSDTTAPSVPTNLSATAVSATQINLTWIASTDNVAVTGYRIYRDGTQINTSTTASYLDTGLNASTTYSYTMAAYDAAGNLSAACAAVTATTSAVPAGAKLYVDGGTLEPGATWDGVNGHAYTCGNGDGIGFAKIQDAVNAMSPGDTIFLRGGTYNETHIDLTPCRNGLSGSPNVMKSYPGEWAKVDGQYQDPTYFRPAVFWGTGGSGMSYWTFENMEITGGGDPTTPPSGGEGILMEEVKHCTFRYLYVHGNHGDQTNPGATGGIRLSHAQYCSIEFCHFKGNGNLSDARNTGNAQLAIVADYAYENPVHLETAMVKNIVRYNLFDGDGGAADKYTPIAIMHKGMQRLTGYVYGETGNPVDSLPNGTEYRDYGDDIHHNIILNSPYGVRIDQDYTQVHHNIIDLSPKSDFTFSFGIMMRDEFSDRRGPVYACAYNNLVRAHGMQGINFRIIPDGYDGSVLGTSVDYFSGFAVNNIIDNASTGYDWAPLCFEGSSTRNCADGEPLRLSDFKVSRNLFYACTQGTQIVRFSNKDFTEAEIETTVSADDVWKIDSVSPYQGASGTLMYKTLGDYPLNGSRNIRNGGIGGAHPYLGGVTMPSYVGAVNPDDEGWVDGVMGLATVENMKNGASGDAPWVE